MSQIPWMKFFPNDWLSSPSVAVMSAEQEGAYLRLLCFCWADRDCSIPNDPKILAVLSKLGDRWETFGTDVQRMFIQHPEFSERLTNARILEERKRVNAKKFKCSKAGVKSGESRRSISNGRSTDVSDFVERNRTISDIRYQISSSSDLKKDPPPPLCAETIEDARSALAESNLQIPEIFRNLELYRVDKKLCSRFDECLKTWSSAYPGISISDEIRKAHAWEMSNPKNRKTQRSRFLNSWFARAQQNASRNGKGNSNHEHFPKVKKFYEES